MSRKEILLHRKQILYPTNQLSTIFLSVVQVNMFLVPTE